MFNLNDNMTTGLPQVSSPALMFNSSDNKTSNLIPQASIPAWFPIFDNIQLVLLIIGVFGNLATLITLSVNGEGISKIIRMLFQYQALLDCVICINAILRFYPPTGWTVGNKVFDTFICHVWHGGFLYWLLAVYSMRNLVIQAVERYLCICHPLRYIALTRKHFRRAIVGVVIVDTLVLIPKVLQTRMRDGLCRFEYFWDGYTIIRFFHGYAYFTFLNIHLIPATLLVVLYFLVLLRLRKRADMDLGASGQASVFNKATKEITKTAIVVTVFFICSTSVAEWRIMLMYAGVVKFVYNSPFQKISYFISVSNFVANPFIYASFMPLYRESVRKTFFKSCIGKN